MFVYLYFSSPFKDWTFSTFHLWITKIGIGAFNFEWREWKSACWCCWIGISRVQFLLMIFTTKWIKFKEKLTLTKFRSWKLILNHNSREYRIVDKMIRIYRDEIRTRQSRHYEKYFSEPKFIIKRNNVQSRYSESMEWEFSTILP